MGFSIGASGLGPDMRAPCSSGNATRASYPPPNWRECVTDKQLPGMEVALRRWVTTMEFTRLCHKANGNGAERECRNGAERLGFRWLDFGVCEDETEDRADNYAHHKLYSMVYPGQRPIPHKAMSAATWTRLCREAGCVGVGRLARTERVLAGMQGRLL